MPRPSPTSMRPALSLSLSLSPSLQQPNERLWSPYMSTLLTSSWSMSQTSPASVSYDDICSGRDGGGTVVLARGVGTRNREGGGAGGKEGIRREGRRGVSLAACYLEGDRDGLAVARGEPELLDGALLVEREVELARVADGDPVEQDAVLGHREVVAQLSRGEEASGS